MSIEKYSDIIDLPHHVSPTRARLPLSDRAAQFSPFAALTGYEAAVTEAGRLTNSKIELDENELEALDRRLALLLEHKNESIKISVCHFVADKRKAGGAYVSTEGIFKKADFDRQLIVLANATEIPISEVISLDSELFENLE